MDNKHITDSGTLESRVYEIKRIDEDEMSKSVEYLKYIDNHIANVKYSARVLARIISDQSFSDKFKEFISQDDISLKCYNFDRVNPTILLRDVESHDDSKYGKFEFDGYRKKFYPTDREKRLNSTHKECEQKINEEFENAWIHHYALNDHHPKYWRIHDLEQWDDGRDVYISEIELGNPIHMPLMNILHMICDWNAMTIALSKDNVQGWYPEDVKSWWTNSAKDERNDLHHASVKVVDWVMDTLIATQKLNVESATNVNTDDVMAAINNITSKLEPFPITFIDSMSMIESHQYSTVSTPVEKKDQMKKLFVYQMFQSADYWRQQLTIWTVDNFLDIEKRKIDEFKTNYPTSDKPEPLFIYNDSTDEYIFNQNNWNGYDVLRNFMLNEVYGRGKIRIHENNLDATASCCYDSDDWRGYILLKPKTGPFDLYTISWYKSRGRTRQIFKNGEPITLQDYVMLLNLFKIPRP